MIVSGRFHSDQTEVRPRSNKLGQAGQAADRRNVPFTEKNQKTSRLFPGFTTQVSLLLQSSSDNRVRVGFDQHEFFVRVYDYYIEVHCGQPFWRHLYCAGAVGVDDISSTDRRRRSNCSILADAEGAGEGSGPA